jgi:hypothetical protein
MTMSNLTRAFRERRKIDAIKALRDEAVFYQGTPTSDPRLSLKSAKDIVEAIFPALDVAAPAAPAPKPVEQRIDVVDSQNPYRVLGSLPLSMIPNSPAKASSVVFALIPRMTSQDIWASPSAPLNEHRIALAFGERIEDGGFTIRITLKAPSEVCLSLLAQVRGFRFPQETAEEAAYRLRYL